MRNMSVLPGLLLIHGTLCIQSTFAQPAPAVVDDQARVQSAPAAMSVPRGRAVRDLVSVLQTIRGQTELYRLQHGGTYPDFQRWPNWEQLTRKTNADGAIKADGSTGPYLPKTPVNPLRGASRVITGAQEGQVVSDRQIGWAFTAEGHIHALDQQGNVLSDKDMDILVNGPRQVASNTGPGARGAATGPATKPALTAAMVARNLLSPDPRIRLEALNALNMKALSDTRILIQVTALAESDPSEDVAKRAREKMEGLRLQRYGLDIGTLVPGLIGATSNSDAAVRRRAVTALGYLDEASDQAIATYRKAFDDPDASVQAAAAERVCSLLNQDGSSAVLLKLFQEAAAKPGATRDAAAYSLTWMTAGPDREPIVAEVDNLVASPDADTRAMGAAAAQLYCWNNPGNDAHLKLVKPEDIIRGVRHRLPWVRATASGCMFDDGWNGPVSGKTVLLEAVADPNAEIASDAARRLCGDLPLGYARQKTAVIFEFEAERRRKAAEESPELSDSVLLCRSKSAAQRLRGVTGLGGKGEAALRAVPVLAELFADPDRRVRDASRKAAVQILTPAKIPGLRY